MIPRYPRHFLSLLAVLACVPFAGSCSREAEKDAKAATPRPPARVSLVKLMSWAEAGPPACDTDLQGHASPARYMLRYAEDGHDPVVIETDNDKLVHAGWAPINRSERGMGFEKSGDFTAIDFDIWEELQCSCDTDDSDPKKGYREGLPVNVKIAWKSKGAPVVTAAIVEDGKTLPVHGVTMNGQLATYEFRFAHKLPPGHAGECSSRFFIALELSEAIYMGGMEPAPVRASLEALESVVLPALADAGRLWYERAKETATHGQAPLVRAFAEAGRRAGRGPLFAVSAERGDEKIALFADGTGPILNPWQREDAVRALLLLAFAGAHTSCEEPARALYFSGDLSERVAVLRALALLPLGPGLTDVVKDALRSNTIHSFAAAVCEKSYFSRHVEDILFFQAALKCLFVGLRMDRIVRIEERTTAELTRMLFAYVTERDNAGRPVAPELWPLVGLFPPEGAKARILARLKTATDPHEKNRLELGLARAAKNSTR